MYSRHLIIIFQINFIQLKVDCRFVPLANCRQIRKKSWPLNEKADFSNIIPHFLSKLTLISQTTTLFIWFFSAISKNFYSCTENTKSFMYDFRFATRVKWGRKVRQKRERCFLLVFQLLKRELRFVLFYTGFFIFFVSCIISNGKLSKKVFKTAANYEGNYVFKLQLYSFCLLTNY